MSLFVPLCLPSSGRLLPPVVRRVARCLLPQMVQRTTILLDLLSATSGLNWPSATAGGPACGPLSATADGTADHYLTGFVVCYFWSELAVCYRRWSGVWPAVCYRRWYSGPLSSVRFFVQYVCSALQQAQVSIPVQKTSGSICVQ
jgi:hypothetical protein